jgi:hypothetical protein
MAHGLVQGVVHGGHQTEAAVVAHRAPATGRYGPRWLITRWGKRRRARRGSIPTFTGACTMARRWHDGGGASAWDGNDVGAMRTKRRRVRGVGISIRGRAAFYRAEARRGRLGAFNSRH